jgi:carbamoylphosphate synthase large subunit
LTFPRNRRPRWQVCLVEEMLRGRQLTFEGYRYRGKTHTLGVVDSITHNESPSFVRYQYPASIPDRVMGRMADISDRIVRQIGLEHTTFNIEFFWNEDTDALGALEINPRHSQSQAELFAQVDGAPNHLAMVRLALGRDPELPHRQGPLPDRSQVVCAALERRRRPPPPQRAGGSAGTA